MYRVHNITQETTFDCDAIETIVYKDGSYHPAEHDAADGFNAMVIKTEEDGREYCEVTPFVYEGHTLSGVEDVGTFEWVDDEDPDIPIVPPEEPEDNA